MDNNQNPTNPSDPGVGGGIPGSSDQPATDQPVTPVDQPAEAPSEQPVSGPAPEVTPSEEQGGGDTGGQPSAGGTV